jgi:putative toxin-antitoxin system antitoxin component (TIGR02293 family)
MNGAERFSRVLDSAERFNESRERAQQWLSRPNPRLGGRTPVELPDTDNGEQSVEELLGQIGEGVLV